MELDTLWNKTETVLGLSYYSQVFIHFTEILYKSTAQQKYSSTLAKDGAVARHKGIRQGSTAARRGVLIALILLISMATTTAGAADKPGDCIGQTTGRTNGQSQTPAPPALPSGKQIVVSTPKVWERINESFNNLTKYLVCYGRADKGNRLSGVARLKSDFVIGAKQDFQASLTLAYTSYQNSWFKLSLSPPPTVAHRRNSSGQHDSRCQWWNEQY